MQNSRIILEQSKIMCNNFLSDNPWLNISWDNPIAEVDRKRIVERYGSINAFENEFKEFGLELQNALPEPYSGNKESNVYCLNMNPGKWDSVFYKNESMLKMCLMNLRHNVNDCLWWENVKDDIGQSHSGLCWIKMKIKRIQELLENHKTPSVFFIEYFPYHSIKGFDFPHYLPSYDYSDKLIMEAMDKNKWIIVMRQKKRWYNRIPLLSRYERLIETIYPAGGWLSPNNLRIKGKENCLDECFVKEIF